MTAPATRTVCQLTGQIAGRSGVLAVLNAADAQLDKLTEAQWVASFAPPITSFRSCVCGATMEKRGTDQITVADDEKAAAVEAVAEMLGCGPLETHRRIVARVIDAINHERAVADGDADRDWDDAHANCGDDRG